MLKKVNTGVQIEQFIRSQEEWGAAEPPPKQQRHLAVQKEGVVKG